MLILVAGARVLCAAGDGRQSTVDGPLHGSMSTVDHSTLYSHSPSLRRLFPLSSRALHPAGERQRFSTLCMVSTLLN